MSLRLKILIPIGLLILSLGLAWTLHARLTLSGLTEDELNKRALAISRGLDNLAGEAVLTNDAFTLYSHINDLKANNPDLKYVVVFDASGKVVASSFPGELPAGLREANHLPKRSGYSLADLRTTEGDVIDIAYPIRGGSIGSIRIGMSKERLQNQVDSLTYDMLTLTAAIIGASLLVTYLLATLLTRPLSRLAEAAKAVGQGDFSQKVPLAGGREAADVARAFNTMTAQLLERQQERNELLARVIRAQEEERGRISRELHDEAGQALTSILLGLKGLEEACQTPVHAAKVAELRSLTAGTLDLMHDIALELRPRSLDDLGLAAALERYVADFGRRYGIETDFHSNGFVGLRLPPETETALYRIAQEALTNTAKHANARSVSVLLDRRDGRVTMVLEDDGCGFDPEQVQASGFSRRCLGIKGMAERVALVGGSITIESRPGAGSTLFVDVPVEGTASGSHPNTHS